MQFNYPEKFQKQKHVYTVGNYMFKVNNRKTRTRCKMCLKLTIKTPEQCQASF